MTRIDAGSTYVADVLPGVLVMGLGLATTVAPLTSTALSAVDDRHAGVASGVNTTVARAAQLAAVAALPLAAGITGETYLDPGEFSDGFHTAMVITAVLAAAGGVIAFLGIRNPQQHPEVAPTPPPTGWFCGAEGPPLDTCPRTTRRGTTPVVPPEPPSARRGPTSDASGRGRGRRRNQGQPRHPLSAGRPGRITSTMTEPVPPAFAAPSAVPVRPVRPARTAALPAPVSDPAADPVVLLDAPGHPSGTLPKGDVHHEHTPLHLAFSCHVVAPTGGSCHPPGRGQAHLAGDVVERLLRAPRSPARRCARPSSAACATSSAWSRGAWPSPSPTSSTGRPWTTAPSSTSCARWWSPRSTPTPVPDPDEVDGVDWVAWDAVRRAGRRRPRQPQPVVGAQVDRLAALAPTPLALLDADVPGRRRRPRRAVSTAPPALPGGARRRGARRAPTTRPPSVVRARSSGPIAAFLADRLAETWRPRPGRRRGGGRGAAACRGRRQAAAARLRLLGPPGHRRRARRRRDRGRRPPLELLHTFALLHDDVMDRSADRRGRPTAHRALAEAPPARRARRRRRLVRRQRRGPGRRPGLPVGRPAARRARRCLRTRLDRARRCSPGCAPRSSPASTSTCGSRRTTAPAPATARALARRVALLKSARYTVTRPLQLGAALAGRPPADAALAAVLGRLRRRGRAGVPAARRRARPVRRPGGHRQEPARRPARGQAHAARRAGAATSRPDDDAAVLAARSATPTLDEARRRAVPRRSWRRRARSPRSRR